jgi:hypothetical protein
MVMLGRVARLFGVEVRPVIASAAITSSPPGSRDHLKRVAVRLATACGLVAALAVLGGCYEPPRLNAPTTLTASCSETRTALLDPAKDYVVKVPSAGLGCPLIVAGGHNVVVISDYADGSDLAHPGRITLTNTSDYSDIGKHYGVLLKDQTGEVWVYNVRIGGDGTVVPIVIAQHKGANVTLQRVHVSLHSHRCAADGQPDPCLAEAHGDCIQSWAGPRVLRVDYFTCETDYFGILLYPQQYGDAPYPERFTFDHMNIRPPTGEANLIRYSFWQASNGDSLWPEGFGGNVWSTPAKIGDPRCATFTPSHSVGWSDCGYQPGWPSFHIGTPPGGDFAP